MTPQPLIKIGDHLNRLPSCLQGPTGCFKCFHPLPPSTQALLLPGSPLSTDNDATMAAAVSASIKHRLFVLRVHSHPEARGSVVETRMPPPALATGCMVPRSCCWCRLHLRGPRNSNVHPYVPILRQLQDISGI